MDVDFGCASTHKKTSRFVDRYALLHCVYESNFCSKPPPVSRKKNAIDVCTYLIDVGIIITGNGLWIEYWP